ncbi:hypothetical protein [Jiangella sp. DSM 45060]|uniref:hypothetical protein n=1 Tax=Jiangella sp. DSM 45060 TaxID=1798224 RepID=UPI00087DDE42|nr:hypothetical protein [Jiangella sp. DSM 45060]SDS61591.1 hypothetical protein SAMN04515669_1499 [Jiangella sp. DSM 45060]
MTNGRGGRRVARPPSSRLGRLPRQAAFGVLLVAALATGRAVEGLMPVDDETAAPFERTGGVGDRVETRWGDVEVTSVAGSTRIEDPYGTIHVTGGVYVVVDWTYTAAGEPQLPAYVAIRDTEGRQFRTSVERNPYSSGGAAQPGIPRRVSAAIELPADAVDGARLVVTLQPNPEDHRRDDIAVIDLGLTGEDADAWAASEEPVEVAEAADGPGDAP